MRIQRFFRRKRKRRSKERASFSEKKNKSRFRAVFVCFILAIMILSASGVYSLDKRLMPSVLTVVDMKSKTKINAVINDSVGEIVKELGVSSSDFYERTTDGDGRILSMSVNTLLVNDICSRVAMDVSGKLVTLEKEKISMPLGSLLGIQAFANHGPDYTVTIIPMGNAQVDYETGFEAVGINQVNFQVWLKVDSVIAVVNPLQRQEITVTRKVSLVNTVITGEVPSVYLSPSGASPR